MSPYNHIRMSLTWTTADSFNTGTHTGIPNLDFAKHLSRAIHCEGNQDTLSILYVAITSPVSEAKWKLFNSA